MNFNLLNKFLRQSVAFFILICFLGNLILPPRLLAQIVSPAQNVGGSSFIRQLPAPGQMLPLSSGFDPAVIKGIKIFPQNSLRFDFIIDPQSSGLANEELKQESLKLIKYFLASLTVPEKDLWVNLSPYEKDRIIPKGFGDTEMGRDLLAQDYLLKQITSTLMYPEGNLGKKFWAQIYEKAYQMFGVTDIPMDAFNKVWIVPQKAVVYENGDSAFVVKSKLKVMLEEDYLSSQSSVASSQKRNLETEHWPLATEIIRQIIIPALEHEVNTGKNFAPLRQIYNSLILATWFKRKIKNSIENADQLTLQNVYIGQNKTGGVAVADKDIKFKIYHQYLKAFKTGVYNYIKEEYDPVKKEIVPRKYFSGGAGFEHLDLAMSVVDAKAIAKTVNLDNSMKVEVRLDAEKSQQKAKQEEGRHNKERKSRKVHWIRNVSPVFAYPKNDQELQILGNVSEAGLTLIQKVVFRGKTYYAKRLGDDNLEGSFDIIEAQAKIYDELNSLKVDGVPKTKYFVELVYSGGERDRMILLEEFPQGQPLQDLIEKGKNGLPIKKALRYILRLSYILKKIHELGISHGYIKGDNVWIGDDGKMVLFDFDLAVHSVKEFLDRELWRIGIPLFLSSARFKAFQSGSALPVTNLDDDYLLRADVYSSIIILVNMIMGERFKPFLDYESVKNDDNLNSRLVKGFLDSTEESRFFVETPKGRLLRKMIARTIERGESPFRTVDEFINFIEEILNKKKTPHLGPEEVLLRRDLAMVASGKKTDVDSEFRKNLHLWEYSLLYLDIINKGKYEPRNRGPAFERKRWSFCRRNFDINDIPGSIQNLLKEAKKRGISVKKPLGSYVEDFYEGLNFLFVLHELSPIRPGGLHGGVYRRDFNVSSQESSNKNDQAMIVNPNTLDPKVLELIIERLKESYKDINQSFIELLRMKYDPEIYKRTGIGELVSEAFIEKLKQQGDIFTKYKILNYESSPGSISEHYFLVVEIEGKWWVIDPAWQQFLPQEKQADVLPQVLIAKTDEFVDVLRQYGISEDKFVIWENPLNTMASFKDIRTNPHDLIDPDGQEFLDGLMKDQDKAMFSNETITGSGIDQNSIRKFMGRIPTTLSNKAEWDDFKQNYLQLKAQENERFQIDLFDFKGYPQLRELKPHQLRRSDFFDKDYQTEGPDILTSGERFKNVGEDEGWFIYASLENIYQHVKGGLGIVVRENRGKYWKISVIDNGSRFKNEKDQDVSLEDAVKWGQSYGKGGKRGLGLYVSAYRYPQFSIIDNPREWMLTKKAFEVPYFNVPVLPKIISMVKTGNNSNRKTSTRIVGYFFPEPQRADLYAKVRKIIKRDKRDHSLKRVEATLEMILDEYLKPVDHAMLGRYAKKDTPGTPYGFLKGFLMHKDPISRFELMQGVGVSYATVQNILPNMVRFGIVEEKKPQGRKNFLNIF